MKDLILLRNVLIGVKKNITSLFPNFHFQHASIYNKEYNPSGQYKAGDFKFPYEDSTFDFAFLTSVFTHLLPNDVDHYLSEIRRVLKPGSKVFMTFFILTPESIKGIETKQSRIDFKFEVDDYRVMDMDKPESAIAFKEADIVTKLQNSGLIIAEPIKYGQWSGFPERMCYHDIIIAIK